MGYTRKQKVFKVSFADDHQFAGLTLTTRGLTVKEFVEFGIRLQGVGEAMQGAVRPDEQMAALDSLSDALTVVRGMFADALMSWNMTEEDGTPTPPTVEGVTMLDEMEFLTLVEEWLNAIGGVSAPLGKDSTGGVTSPELSPLMEPLSVNQVS